MSDTVNKRVEIDPWRCTRCGACLAVCPTYRVMAREIESPRGRVALARAFGEGKLELGAHTAELLYRCTQCAACNTACPGGLKVDEILMGLRTELAHGGLLPENLARLQGAVEDQHNILGEEQKARILWQESDGGAAQPRPAEIVFFVGCVSALFPSSYAMPQQTARLLRAAKADFTVLGGEEWCCGYPLLLNGREDAMEAAAKEMVARVKALGAKTVVTSCPSCYHAWKHVYPEFVGELPFEVLHASELLLRFVKEGRLQLQPQPEQTVTYHDPCDLGRRSGVYDAPRELLKAIPGIKLVEMKDKRENALCCGGGGNMESAAPKLVEEAAGRRLHQALDAHATVIATACPQCRRTLTAAARREKARVRVLDLAEILSKAVPE
jgi:heterodisulfide reductase subunit D